MSGKGVMKAPKGTAALRRLCLDLNTCSLTEQLNATELMLFAMQVAVDF